MGKGAALTDSIAITLATTKMAPWLGFGPGPSWNDKIDNWGKATRAGKNRQNMTGYRRRIKMKIETWKI